MYSLFRIFEDVLYKLYVYVLSYVILVCLMFLFSTFAEAFMHSVEDHLDRLSSSIVLYKSTHCSCSVITKCSFHHVILEVCESCKLNLFLVYAARRVKYVTWAFQSIHKVVTTWVAVQACVRLSLDWWSVPLQMRHVLWLLDLFPMVKPLNIEI